MNCDTRPGCGLEGDLHEYIERVRIDWENVGAAIAVVRGDEVLWAQGFGARELGSAAPVDEFTCFQVGSTTKAFTATALGMLVDAGVIRWDAHARQWLPGFELRDMVLAEQLTLVDMLAHRSGLSQSYYPFLRAMSADEVVRELRYVASDGPFRRSAIYNNLMYATAGKIVEEVSGHPWSDFIDREILRPLCMARSFMSPLHLWRRDQITPTFLGFASAGDVRATDALDANIAMPHVRDDAGTIVSHAWQSYDNAAAAGSLVSCARDMAHWMIFHLNEARFEGRQHLTPETLREMHAPRNPCEPPYPLSGVPCDYALGWMRSRFRSQVLLMHGGGILGFPAYIALLPASTLGVAVLSNGPTRIREEYGFHKAVAFEVFDRLLKAPAQDWNRALLARDRLLEESSVARELELRQQRDPDSRLSLPLSAYAGTYEEVNGRSGPVSITVHAEGLVLSFSGPGAFRAPLEGWCADQFRVRPAAWVENALGPIFVSFSVENGVSRALSAFGDQLLRVSGCGS